VTGAVQERAAAAAGPEGRWAHTYAALDLGTNNCRLLVARPTRDGFRVIDAFSRIVRLGEGVSTTGRLSPAAMDRTLDALGVCARKMRRRGVTRVRAIATEACRRAENRVEFFARVYDETGIALTAIATEEEAGLALAGCAPLFEPPARYAVLFDIGGGSTQVLWVRVDHDAPRATSEVLASVSLPCGVVTLSETFGGDRIAPEVYAAMVGHVAEHLAPFEDAQRIAHAIDAGDVQMVGTSGTVTTLAGVLLDLPRYERARVDGVRLGFAEVDTVIQRLAVLDYASRAAHPCIGRERADLVVAGCAILDAICRAWPVGRLRVGDRGLREGILHALMADADAEAVAASGAA